MRPDLPGIRHEFVEAKRPAARREELTHGMAPYVPNPTIRYMPGVGYWSRQEAAGDVNRMLGAWLDDEPVPSLPGDERHREPPAQTATGCTPRSPA